MFRKNYTLKSEIITIDVGNDEFVKASLAIDTDDAEVYVTINDLNSNNWFWIFDVEDNFSKYFDIKDTVDFAIMKSNNIDEFIDMLNDIFLECYYNILLRSSFDSYEDLHGLDDCEKCEDRYSCEEYLKHKN